MSSSPISPCASCPPHAAAGHSCTVYSSSVTDAQWAILEPLLAAPGNTAGRGGRPEKHCRRVIVDAILYIVRGSFSTIGLVWADGGYPARLLIWAKDVLTLRMRIIKRIPGATGFHIRPRIWVVERSFAWINKHRRCVRDYETRTRPPRSHGPPHHDHNHDQATRPNLTVFKHPLSEVAAAIETQRPAELEEQRDHRRPPGLMTGS
jgi:transposase